MMLKFVAWMGYNKAHRIERRFPRDEKKEVQLYTCQI